MGRCTWLYVLSDINEEYFYVGMTYRLITRLREHKEGRGSEATKRWVYDTLQAVYKIDDDRQHNHGLEDELTLKLMKGRGGAWWKVRGGKWHHTAKKNKPQELVDMQHFPETCMCHYPVTEKVSKEGRAFVTCARSNMDWLRENGAGEFCDITEESCDYFRWSDE